MWVEILISIREIHGIGVIMGGILAVLDRMVITEVLGQFITMDTEVAMGVAMA